MSSGIYKITNKLNQKFYIGKSKNIEGRWKQHKYATDSTPLHLAMQKYGSDQFELSILEICDDEEKLSEKEIYWIEYYNAYESDNYNATRGGDGASHPVKLSHDQLLEIIDKLRHTNETMQAIADQYGVSKTTIISINQGKSRKLLGENYPIRIAPTLSKTDDEELFALLWETKGNFEYIAKLLGITAMSVRQRCKTRGYSTRREDYGYVDTQEYHSIRVWQCDPITKERIKNFPSIRAAAREMNCNPESIRRAISSKTHISKGYYWITE